jgi:hypothetical protein
MWLLKSSKGRNKVSRSDIESTEAGQTMDELALVIRFEQVAQILAASGWAHERGWFEGRARKLRAAYWPDRPL